MSICIADAMSPYENKGEVGMTEMFDTEAQLAAKCVRLANLLRKSRCCSVITGAGISTSAGIADFRGPKGVWTLEKQGKPADSVEFTNARPTLTHLALCELEKRGVVKYLISQNVDGLHPQSGFPLNRLAELHGNVFCEDCEKCQRRYYRSFCVGSVGRRVTGRTCEGTSEDKPCGGDLRDFVLDWTDLLPEPDLGTSYTYAKNSDLILCLGTSMQITPVGEIPLFIKSRGKIVTVNLQATRLEKTANLAIHGRVDEVMRRVLAHLEIPIPDVSQAVAGIVPCSINALEDFESPSKSRKRKLDNEEEKTVVEQKFVEKKEENIFVGNDNPPAVCTEKNTDDCNGDPSSICSEVSKLVSAV